MMSDVLESGRASLESLGQQREALKGIQRRAFDIMSMLGVSNSVMRMIERRSENDKMLVYAGMVVTLICIYGFYKLFR